LFDSGCRQIFIKFLHDNLYACARFHSKSWDRKNGTASAVQGRIAACVQFLERLSVDPFAGSTSFISPQHFDR
jgi:hypothetical protein